jgi:glutaminyl-peptide cyclotransferase
MTAAPKVSRRNATGQKISGQTWFLTAVVVASCLVVGYILFVDAPQHRGGGSEAAAAPTSKFKLADIPFDGQKAYAYLKQICDLGPRVSGSPAMTAQRAMLQSYFEKLGAKVTVQSWRVRHPMTGAAVEMANLIVEWRPEAKERILLGVHYDTRPFPDQDPRNPRGHFLGANDGASGVALLMQLGAVMKEYQGKVGVDFIFFDGEEFIFSDRDAYFLGSIYFAEQYVAQPPSYKYRMGAVLDMIGDKNLQILEEGNSMGWAPSKAVTQSIWATAHKLGVREFVSRVGATVNDDHMPLCEKAKIPVCDVIDFDYPFWHTEGDTADKCSALSLAKVGWVIQEWLKTSGKQ